MGLWVVWSEDKVVSLCVCVAGNIPEDRFVEYFVETLKKEEDGQFDTTVEQFMECAKACRESKLAERKAADAALRNKTGADSRLLDETKLQLERILAEKVELDCMVEDLNQALAAQVVAFLVFVNQ